MEFIIILHLRPVRGPGPTLCYSGFVGCDPRAHHGVSGHETRLPAVGRDTVTLFYVYS